MSLSLNTKEVRSPYPHPVIIGQNRTEHLLEQHLNGLGVNVEWQVETTGFQQDEDGVSVTLRHADGTEEVARAKYLVGCDGAHSIVRKKLELSFEGSRYENEQFIQADAKIRWTLPKGVSYLFLTKEGYMMVIEMPDDCIEAAKVVNATEDLAGLLLFCFLVVLFKAYLCKFY